VTDDADLRCTLDDIAAHQSLLLLLAILLVVNDDHASILQGYGNMGVKDIAVTTLTFFGHLILWSRPWPLGSRDVIGNRRRTLNDETLHRSLWLLPETRQEKIAGSCWDYVAPVTDWRTDLRHHIKAYKERTHNVTIQLQWRLLSAAKPCKLWLRLQVWIGFYSFLLCVV